MKRKWYVCLLVAPIILILALIVIGAGSGKSGASYASQSADQFLSQTKNLEPEIVPGVVAVKIKSAAAAQTLAKATTITGLSSLDAKLQRFGATSVQKMFRHKPIPLNSNLPDLSRILKVRIPERLSPMMVARELESDSNVEYAEPVYVRRFYAVPNDPMYSQQRHLPQIHAPEAWNIQKGDSSVLIAIVDGGVDYRHEDLAANVWTNEPEAKGVTGVDDDGNGFVDDIHGWDFGENDSDPIDVDGHGTVCTGMAGAVTNNNKGIAGASWNCEFMPVKIVNDNDLGFLEFGFDGIIYLKPA
jgi:subtilisin family serine protease